MKVHHFKLLCNLPEEYNYEFFMLAGERLVVIGKNGQKVIGFFIEDDKLTPMQFSKIEDQTHKE